MGGTTSRTAPAVGPGISAPALSGLRRVAIRYLGCGCLILAIIAAALHGARTPVVTFGLGAAMSFCGIILALASYPRREDVAVCLVVALSWLWVWWHPPVFRPGSLQAAAMVAGAASMWFASTRMARESGRREWVALTLILCGGAFVAWTFFAFATDTGGARTSAPSSRLTDTDLVLALLATFAFSRVTQVIKSGSRAQLSKLTRLTDMLGDSLWSVLILIMALAYLWSQSASSGFVLAIAGIAVFLMLDIRHWPRRDKARGSRIWLVLAGAAASSAAVFMVGVDLFTASTPPGGASGFDLEMRLRQIVESTGFQLELWRQSPAFGHGFGSYDTVRELTAQARPDLLVEGRFHLDTMFLRGLVELGLVGMTVVLTGIVHVLIVYRRAMNTTAASQTPMKLALATLAIFGLSGLTDLAWTAPAAIWITVFLIGHGYGAAVSRTTNTRQEA